MPKVVVSLTTISHRVDNLHLTLESLLNQDIRDIEVVVYVSPDPFLLDTGVDAIPEACRNLMRDDARLAWRSVPNIGPYRKLLPALMGGLYANSLIVTADDDTIYPPNWLSTLVYYYNIHKCIIASRGHFMARSNGAFSPYRQWMAASNAENPSLYNLPTGKDGVLYHPMFFHKRVLDYRTALDLAKTADDLWFKWHTVCYRVPVYLVHRDYKALSFADTNSGPSLYDSYNQDGGNDRTVTALEHYAEHSLGFRHATL